MAGEGKVRKGLYIEEDLLEQIDGLLEQADVKSRNEFLNQALKFYIGYLTSEKIENYMLSTTIFSASVIHLYIHRNPWRNWCRTFCKIWLAGSI